MLTIFTSKVQKVVYLIGSLKRPEQTVDRNEYILKRMCKAEKDSLPINNVSNLKPQDGLEPLSQIFN